MDIFKNQDAEISTPRVWIFKNVYRCAVRSFVVDSYGPYVVTLTKTFDLYLKNINIDYNYNYCFLLNIYRA